MSTIVPPPPTGSILQKESSFSRPKTNAAAAAAAAATSVTATHGSSKPASPIGGLRAGAPASTSAVTSQSAALPGSAQTAVPPRSSPAPHQHPPAKGPPAPPVSTPVPLAASSKMRGTNAQPKQPTRMMGAGADAARPAPTPTSTPATTPSTTAARRGPGPVSTPAAEPPNDAPKQMAQPQPLPQPGLMRRNSAGGSFGSMGSGMLRSYGSMGAGPTGMGGTMPPNGMGGAFGSMGAIPALGYGSMARRPSGIGSIMGSMGAGFGMGNPYGSMSGGMNGGGSAYGSLGDGGAPLYRTLSGGPNGMGGPMGSLYGMGGPYGSMGPGGMMIPMGSMMAPQGSLYGGGFPMGSMYGMGANSTLGIASQWGSLACMSMGGGAPTNRSGISSGYGGFASEAKAIDTNELCPNIGTFEGAKDVKRSGKRGGNHLYNHDKHEKPVENGNSNATAMTIRRKADNKASRAASPGNGGDAAATSSTNASAQGTSASKGKTAAGSSNGKTRAKAPSNYNVHSLIIVDGASGTEMIKVKDPNTIVYEKNGKKETFEEDEAIARAKEEEEELDSVLLSELRGNWFNGHNSALLLCAGKDKVEASREVARLFLRQCVERLEKNEKDTSVRFDISMTMVSLRDADQCCDLLKSGAEYGRMVMGSSPVYGPCLLDLETRNIKTAHACVEAFDEGIANAKEAQEMLTAFFVLKTIKKIEGESEVHLSSLCITLCGSKVAHLTGIREKDSTSPHRLFRYAVDGACVTVCALCLSSLDEDAREALEVERKMREVKNQPPRSGNVKRFVEYTVKEIARQKDKLSSASDNEKKVRETQIERMEEMLADAKLLLKSPEDTKPKGYAMGR